jgi:hypothetical protein
MLDEYDSEEEIITLNVAGMRYQTREFVLERFPETVILTCFDFANLYFSYLEIL